MPTAFFGAHRKFIYPDRGKRAYAPGQMNHPSAHSSWQGRRCLEFWRCRCLCCWNRLNAMPHVGLRFLYLQQLQLRCTSFRPRQIQVGDSESEP